MPVISIGMIDCSVRSRIGSDTSGNTNTTEADTETGADNDNNEDQAAEADPELQTPADAAKLHTKVKVCF